MEASTTDISLIEKKTMDFLQNSKTFHFYEKKSREEKLQVAELFYYPVVRELDKVLARILRNTIDDLKEPWMDLRNTEERGFPEIVAKIFNYQQYRILEKNKQDGSFSYPPPTLCSTGYGSCAPSKGRAGYF